MIGLQKEDRMLQWSDRRKNVHYGLDQSELLEELYRQMFIVAYSKLKNKPDALDAVQESWVKILRKIDTLRDRDKLIQWAKVITANTSINIWKKKQQRNEVLVQELEYDAKSAAAGMIEESLLAADVKQSLEELDKDTRLMFIYKFYFGWKDQQIADSLGYPVGTVKARIHRGKHRLRKMLHESYGKR